MAIGPLKISDFGGRVRCVRHRTCPVPSAVWYYYNPHRTRSLTTYLCFSVCRRSPFAVRTRSPMDCASTLYSHRNNGLMTRSLEKLLEDAHLCGELKLGGRKLKEFPVTNKYDLSDTTIAGTNRVEPVTSIIILLYLSTERRSNRLFPIVPRTSLVKSPFVVFRSLQELLHTLSGRID